MVAHGLQGRLGEHRDLEWIGGGGQGNGENPKVLNETNYEFSVGGVSWIQV